MNKFKTGQTYSTRSICDHNCIFSGVVINRSARRVTLNVDMQGVVTVGILVDEQGNEYCYPIGRYSMAPIFRA